GIDGNPSAIGAPYCDRFVPVSTHDAEAVAEALHTERADGIATCGSELSLTTTVRVAEKLSLPFYADVATVERCQSKDLMRAAYQAGGAPSPAFVHVETLALVEQFVRQNALPVIIKPSRGWGQRGVSKVEKPEELVPAFERAREASSTG